MEAEEGDQGGGQGPEKGIAVGDFSVGLQTTSGLVQAAQGQHKAG